MVPWPRSQSVSDRGPLMRAGASDVAMNVVRFPTTLTVQQAAPILGCSTYQVLRLIRAGKLRATRFGRAYKIPDTEIEACITRALGQCDQDTSSESEPTTSTSERTPHSGTSSAASVDESLLDQLRPRISR